MNLAASPAVFSAAGRTACRLIPSAGPRMQACEPGLCPDPDRCLPQVLPHARLRDLCLSLITGATPPRMLLPSGYGLQERPPRTPHRGRAKGRPVRSAGARPSRPTRQGRTRPFARHGAPRRTGDRARPADQAILRPLKTGPTVPTPNPLSCPCECKSDCRGEKGSPALLSVSPEKDIPSASVAGGRASNT